MSEKLIAYGNLGSYIHNYALYEAEHANCSHNFVAIISFFMFGRGICNYLLKIIPTSQQCESGDIETVANYLMDLAIKIDLYKIKT